jgi:Transposase and inactivated derivatives
MGKKKYSLEFKRRVARHYLESGEGAQRTGDRFGIDHGTVRRWVEHYKVRGDAGFLVRAGHTSAEYKETVILSMWDNGDSSRKAAARFGIAASCTVSRWERLYREGGIIALQNKPKGRPPLSEKKTGTDNKVTAPHPEFKTIEEELEYLRAENAYLKKLRALIQEQGKSKLPVKRK